MEAVDGCHPSPKGEQLMDTKYATFDDLIELPAVVDVGSNSQHERQTFICPYCQRKFSLTNKSVKLEKIEPETVYAWRETSVKIAYIACQCKIRFILRYINPQGDQQALQRWFNERSAPETLASLT